MLLLRVRVLAVLACAVLGHVQAEDIDPCLECDFLPISFVCVNGTLEYLNDCYAECNGHTTFTNGSCPGLRQVML